MKEVKCPHCKAWPDEEYYIDGEVYDCHKCGKPFMVFVDFDVIPAEKAEAEDD